RLAPPKHQVRRAAVGADASKWKARVVAAELAAGEYVAVLDPGDVLAPHALYEVARLLEEDPDADVVYTDEDKLAERGRHRRALAEHLDRRGLAAHVETQPNGTQRAVWPVVDPPLVSIIIPTRDKPELIKQCVDGMLRRTSYPRKEIVLVDTFSLDPTVHE